MIMFHTTGATIGAGTAHPSGAPEFTPCFSGFRVTRSLALYVCFVDCCLSFFTFSFVHCVVCPSLLLFFCPLCCLSSFTFFLLSTVLSVLRFTDSDFPFGVFKLFLPLTSYQTKFLRKSLVVAKSTTILNLSRQTEMKVVSASFTYKMAEIIQNG